MWGQGLINICNMLQMKVYVCYKTSSNLTPIQKSALKNKESKTLNLIAQGNQGKSIKVIKVLRVKCAPVTDIVSKELQ